jgi:hypothetical protein
MGVARLVLAGLAVLAFVVLIVVGVLSLVGALDPAPESVALPAPTASSPAASAPAASAPATAAPKVTASAAVPTTPASPGRVPTVLIQCVRDRCPTVFLKVVGGDVLLNREMVKDEQAQSFDAKVDVVLADSTALRVQVNGAVRPPGKTGERQEFTVSRGQ